MRHLGLFISVLSVFALPGAAHIREYASEVRIEPKNLARFRRPKSLRFPASNTFTREKFDLGKTLFFDPRLSGSGNMACATCHDPARSWTDGLPRASGAHGKVLKRRTPALWNVAWASRLFWDGRASSLEEQALMPIQAPDEMNMPLDELPKRIQGIAEYQELFAKAFPGEEIHVGNIAQAIATFERTLVSPTTAFDALVEGNSHAVSESAKRGFIVFTERAHCVQCHSGWAFTNGSFADIGLVSTDLGMGDRSKDPDVSFAFKVPTLRKISDRKFFMHDGSFNTLDAVIENYDIGGFEKRTTTLLFLKPLGLTAREKKDLIAFLKTL